MARRRQPVARVDFGQHPERADLAVGVAVFDRQRERGVALGERLLRTLQVRQRVRLAAPRAALKVRLAQGIAPFFEPGEAGQRALVVAAVERQIALVFECDRVGARAGQGFQRLECFVQQALRRFALAELAQRFGRLHEGQPDTHRPAGRARQFQPALHPFKRGVMGIQAGEAVADIGGDIDRAPHLAGGARRIVGTQQQADRAPEVAGLEGGSALVIVDPAAGRNMAGRGVVVETPCPALMPAACRSQKESNRAAAASMTSVRSASSARRAALAPPPVRHRTRRNCRGQLRSRRAASARRRCRRHRPGHRIP
ncbi:hypothetical protein LP419_15350 [Massilia sp. H-1]|nr:hypothetical protein LP419_15350 [Massilia sp. H-1]